jgi:hypothetical protein
MTDLRSSVLSCIEHERLEFELLELRTRGQYLSKGTGSGGAIAAGGS